MAKKLDLPFENILMELGPNGANAAYFVIDEELMRVLLADAHVMFGTDGSALSRHPRGHGTFARVFARHVGESRGLTLTLESAVRKATQLPATTIGLDDRGELRVGAFADVIAFDPKSFEDRADFEHPDRLAVGMRRVLVGGVIEWRDGKTVKGSGGRALRRKP